MQLKISILLTALLSQVSFGQNKDLIIVRNFAEQYNPSFESNMGVPALGNIKNEVINAIKELRGASKVELEKYLTLIFIKLYRAHLECCHQSFELRLSDKTYIDQNQDPLLYEFNLIIKMFKQNEMIPFISSRISYDYVMSHSYLLEYNKIKSEIKIIDRLLDKINKGIYWKD